MDEKFQKNFHFKFTFFFRYIILKKTHIFFVNLQKRLDAVNGSINQSNIQLPKNYNEYVHRDLVPCQTVPKKLNVPLGNIGSLDSVVLIIIIRSQERLLYFLVSYTFSLLVVLNIYLFKYIFITSTKYFHILTYVFIHFPL